MAWLAMLQKAFSISFLLCSRLQVGPGIMSPFPRRPSARQVPVHCAPDTVYGAACRAIGSPVQHRSRAEIIRLTVDTLHKQLEAVRLLVGQLIQLVKESHAPPPEELVCPCLQAALAKAPRTSSVRTLLNLFGQRTPSGSSQAAAVGPLADSGPASLLGKSIANLRSTLRKPEQPESVSWLPGFQRGLTVPLADTHVCSARFAAWSPA